MTTAGYPSLAFVVRRRAGGRQHVELPKPVADGPAVKAGNELARTGVDVVDGANIAVVHLLVLVVLDLHDLVAGRKGPAEPLHLAIAGACSTRKAVDRRIAIHQNVGRSGTEVLRRRHRRRHHHGIEYCTMAFRHRAQFELHLQGTRRRCPASGPRTRRALCARRQRPQEREQAPHHRAAH